MSSSRVQTTFTGPETCIAIRTARRTKSTSSRRPKPPPRRWLCTWTRSRGRPVSCAAAVRVNVGTCVPTQMSQPSRRTWTVQLTGSIVACVRPLVPPDGERREPLLRRPHVIGDHGYGVVEPHYLLHPGHRPGLGVVHARQRAADQDRKSTRLNSSHLVISYAVF